jgi:glucose-6-phosphate 1-dehydrogenase
MKNKSKLQPTTLVIFGGSGDLTWRKLVPALYDLFEDDLLPDKFSIIGVYRKPISGDDWREHLREGVRQFARHKNNENTKWEEFSTHLVSCQAGDVKKPETFDILSKTINEQKSDLGDQAEIVFYMAVPPSIVTDIVDNLGKAGLTKDSQHSRLVFEKPFGHDQQSAHEINKALLKTLSESQIYRIDHFLGKETIQNILAFRFANTLFEPIWDRRYIDHIQITVAETLGVEHRGGYYEHAGALRDMIQNHLMQILSLIAMESPVAFTADEILPRKVDVLRAIRPIPADKVHLFAARGQYGSGWLQGEQVPAYRDEPDINPVSNTETFAAMKLFIDNWRWQGVPFYMRTGKRMAQDISKVIIQFRPVPHQSFPVSAAIDWQPNRLEIDIQPDEGISLSFMAKQPGVTLQLSPKQMDFRYAEAFKTDPPEPYETLLLDVMEGDASLFMRADQVECAWQVVDPVLEVWNDVDASDFPNYPSGTWGPESAEALIARDGRSWL